MNLPAKISDWPEHWKFLFEERAAIMEQDGLLPRPSAEFWAEKDIRKQAEKEGILFA